MQTNMFPPVFFAQSNNNMNAQIEESNRVFYNARDSINRSWWQDPEKESYGVGGFFVGVVAGFLGCVTICGYDNDYWFGGIITWVVVIVLSILIGLGICAMVQKTVNSHNQIINSKVEQEAVKCDQRNANIQNQAAIEQQNYLDAFEQNAQNMSVQLAESELAKEVIQWMTDGFSKTIDAADRRSHIEQISVPFQFKVFVDKITCNLGTYDFELKRCRNLTSPLEQTALARAIAAAIQFNITMKYPKDASGTDRAVNFEFSYTDTHPVATLTYAAPNGNYQAVRSW